MGERYSRGTMIGVHTPTDFEGGPLTIGTTAVALVFTSRTKIFLLEGGRRNTGTIYLGKSNILSDGSYRMHEIDAGQWISFDYNDVSNAMYAVATQADQILLSMAFIFNPENMSSEL